MSVMRDPVTPADHVQGNINAPVTLVEYGDFECAYCGAAYPIVKRVQKRFGKNLRFVFRHFPMAQAHPNAEIAAETAEFAAVADRFWQAHAGIYENQDLLNAPFLLTLAEELGLSPLALREALEDGTFAPRVRSNFRGGILSGVNGTPTFFINGQRHDGSYEFDFLVAAIESTLGRPHVGL